MGVDEVGVQAKRFAVFGNGFGDVPLSPQDESQVAVRQDRVGIDPQRFTEFGDGLVNFSLKPQRVGEFGMS